MEPGVALPAPVRQSPGGILNLLENENCCRNALRVEDLITCAMVAAVERQKRDAAFGPVIANIASAGAESRWEVWQRTLVCA